jgi:hypothetical protein
MSKTLVSDQLSTIKQEIEQYDGPQTQEDLDKLKTELNSDAKLKTYSEKFKNYQRNLALRTFTIDHNLDLSQTKVELNENIHAIHFENLYTFLTLANPDDQQKLEHYKSLIEEISSGDDRDISRANEAIKKLREENRADFVWLTNTLNSLSGHVEIPSLQQKIIIINTAPYLNKYALTENGIEKLDPSDQARFTVYRERVVAYQNQQSRFDAYRGDYLNDQKKRILGRREDHKLTSQEEQYFALETFVKPKILGLMFVDYTKDQQGNRGISWSQMKKDLNKPWNRKVFINAGDKQKEEYRKMLNNLLKQAESTYNQCRSSYQDNETDEKPIQLLSEDQYIALVTSMMHRFSHYVHKDYKASYRQVERYFTPVAQRSGATSEPKASLFPKDGDKQESSEEAEIAQEEESAT